MVELMPKFEELKTSTRTVMVYTNLMFDLPTIFESVPVEEIDAPLTKKQKNVDKKKLNVPKGVILGAQYKMCVRGTRIKKKKKKWCHTCKPMKVVRNIDTHHNTVVEFISSN